ncbi:MBL fold metallo-hydrolase [Alkalibacillus aidingensis]|uniref:MBL fold metallo-hydrolase n=1 Tax=Alkalibacillus aidingensis TaxID=2747607 RepID=UPI001661375D|nr:MBL fold metallo-hydrolase [Alkalibacillus aidingensis]
MKIKQLNDDCYCFESSVNIGYVHKGEHGMIIDAGIDQSSIRKVVRQLESKQLPITHLFITHAHADHYGGAFYLKKHYNIKVIAPKLEAAIVENPIIEPIYMFQGNAPLDELRNKFLEGPPVQVDQVVDEGTIEIDRFHLELILTPGHSYHQLAVATEGILYAADSYFGEEELDKHKIPFIISAKDTIASLKKLVETNYDGAIPGHGRFETNYHETLQTNIKYHQKILDNLEKELKNHPEGCSHEEIVAKLCEMYEIKADQLSMFLLFRTAVTSYITALIEEGKIKHEVKNYRIVFYPS